MKVKVSKTVISRATLLVWSFLPVMWASDGQTGVQRGVVSSSTRVVVVLIRGFQLESIVFGVLLGMSVWL